MGSIDSINYGFPEKKPIFSLIKSEKTATWFYKKGTVSGAL
jgi:hypothetical protein